MAVTPNIVNMPNTVKQSGPRVRTQLGVLHSAECPLKRGYPMSLTQWTIDTAVQASWHEFVGPGVVVQAVHSDYVAWHASVANWISWGTEQTGYAAFTRAQWLTKDGRDQLERLAMQWAGDAHYFEWNLSDLRWLPTSTVRAIVAGNDTTTKGFCTHAQIDPASRSDPGPNYPYDLLMKRTRAHFAGTSLQASAPRPIDLDPLEKIMALSKAERAELLNDIGEAVWDERMSSGDDPHFQARTHMLRVHRTAQRLEAQNTALIKAVSELANNPAITAEALEAMLNEAVSDFKVTLAPEVP